MTLIVSLRTSDGIVIAGDSLSTMMAYVEIQGTFTATCPECGSEHEFGPQTVGGVNVPSTTFSYAQKVFPFCGKFGIETYGWGQLFGKTIYFAVRELEQQLKSGIEGQEPEGVTEASQRVGEHLNSLLISTVPNVDDAPDDWYPVGFKIVGYDESEAKIIEVKVGKQVAYNVEDANCTVSGQTHVVQAIWGLYEERPEDQAAYSVFSLQDAIAYAEFLINMTASYQQFSGTIPSVGGDIDIGLVTPFDNFRWIRKKSLN